MNYPPGSQAPPPGNPYGQNWGQPQYPPQPMGPPPLGGLLIFVSIVNIAVCLFLARMSLDTKG